MNEGTPDDSGSAPRSEPRGKLGLWFERALFCAALGLLGFALWPRPSGPKTGALAPVLVLPHVGEAGSTEVAPAGKPLLIEAFASWCTACRRSNEHVAALREAERLGRLDVVLVSVDDDPRAAERAKATWPIPGRVLHDRDGRFARAYGVRVLPTYVLVAPDGTVTDVTTGAPGALALRRWLTPDD